MAASSFEEDLLHDDLPSNTDFVTKNSGTSRKTNAAKLPRVKETGGAGSIRILSQDAFDLYQDYMTELEDSKMKSENSRQVIRLSLSLAKCSSLGIIVAALPLCSSLALLSISGYYYTAVTTGMSHDLRSSPKPKLFGEGYASSVK